MELQFINLVLEYISENVYVLVPVLFFIGFLLKQTPKVADWFIPYLLTFVGISFALGLLGVNIEAVIQGILVAAVTIFIHQLLKQADQKINFKEFLARLYK